MHHQNLSTSLAESQDETPSLLNKIAAIKQRYADEQRELLSQKEELKLAEIQKLARLP